MSVAYRYLFVMAAFGAAAATTGCIEIERAPAYVRVLNVSLDYDELDLYVDDTMQLQDVGYETITNYAKLTATDSTLEFTASGITSALQSLDMSLSGDSHRTLIALGNTGSFSAIEVNEDADPPDSGEAKVTIVNAASDAGQLDIYLTDASASLADVSPAEGDMAPGTTAEDAPLIVDSGSYRLRVTAAGSKSDIRFDSESLSLDSRSITTVIVTGTPGGVLVNAAVLQQQGTFTLLRNQKSRLRVGVGIDEMSSVSVLAGDQTILSSAPYASLSKYQLVGTGGTTLEAKAGGATLVTVTASLEAGHDYTLLVYSKDLVEVGTLVEDSNRLPSSGNVNFRLINLMTGLGTSISAAVDYYPTVENVDLGQASLYVAMATASDARVDVTNTTTAASLYYLTGVDFASDSVFTLVMFGSPSATIGVMRQDR